jgi:hypothetical protein
LLSKLHPPFIGAVIAQRYPGLDERLPVALSLRGTSMRIFPTMAAALSLYLLSVAGGFAAAPTAQTAVAPATAVPVSSDAAAKHAKRTACLKNAKTKKLVGADKTSFLKSCIAAP